MWGWIVGSSGNQKVPSVLSRFLLAVSICFPLFMPTLGVEPDTFLSNHPAYYILISGTGYESLCKHQHWDVRLFLLTSPK